MAEKIRAILIDAEKRTISEVEIDKDDIQDIYKLLRIDSPFDCVPWSQSKPGETVYVDDEGLLKRPKFFFRCPGYPEWLAGNGLIIGTGEQGESKSTELSLSEVKAQVLFGASEL